ncbi:eukaryotic translation initiation factor 3 subunit M-like [Iris pallida]|uniref:Eukaryotic translation initiation factor 3 subunit M n=1 Tax=Iris pallida TaxID=29817 RepID=A0AAX6EKW3_IRIPA|nr:eukaryotic translation initiation factor 3 subunit M-like [Iris pallida]KAJ6844751.1 eukaryotic translation initiation factor 3 subunit M-like [Iris pallida]
MTTIVPTSEEDPVVAVVRFTSELAWKDAGPEVAEPQVAREIYEAEQCIIMSRWLDLVSLMVTSADLVISRVSDKDLECIFTVICNLVTRATSPDEALEMAKLISAKVIQQPNDRPALRLKILFNLYNLLEKPYSKFFVYTKALNLAVSGKVTESIIPSFKKIESLLQEWNIGKVDQRDLFLIISNILKENKSMAKDSFTFLTKYLATFSGEAEESSTMPEAKEEAVRAILEFVKSPDMFHSDLLDMPVVVQLENDGKYALVYQLLKIFLTQKLDAYLEFHAADATFLKSYGLVHEDCIAKMRLMSLVDLSSTDSGEIPYSLIKETLGITEDEVEYWVVKAITSKILDCRIDQMNQIVIVNRRTERVFGPSQWQALHSKLAVWRANVANAISTIQANKPDEGTQAMQGVATR